MLRHGFGAERSVRPRGSPDPIPRGKSAWPPAYGSVVFERRGGPTAYSIAPGAGIWPHHLKRCPYSLHPCFPAALLPPTCRAPGPSPSSARGTAAGRGACRTADTTHKTTTKNTSGTGRREFAEILALSRDSNSRSFKTCLPPMSLMRDCSPCSRLLPDFWWQPGALPSAQMPHL